MAIIKTHDSHLELAQKLLHAQVDQQNKPNQNPIQNSIKILGSTQYSFTFDITIKLNLSVSGYLWIFLNPKNGKMTPSGGQKFYHEAKKGCYMGYIQPISIYFR